MTTKRIWLAGAKGAGKSELLKALEGYNLGQQNKGLDHPYLIPNQLKDKIAKDEPIDRLADYRTEIGLVLDRVHEQEYLDHGIFESSLLDSVAYAATRMSYIINDGTGNADQLARWELVLHVSARMLRDSELPDAVIFVPGHAEEDFYEKLEEAVTAAVWEFLPDEVQKFKLVETEVLQRVEETATILDKLNEPSDTTAESNGED